MITALQFYERAGAHRNIAITLRGIALVKTALGDHIDALQHATDALATFDELGLDLDAAMACNCIGWVHYRAGHHQDAATAYREALDRSQRCGSSFEAARAETGLGNIAATTGHPKQAQHHWNRAAEHHPTSTPPWSAKPAHNTPSKSIRACNETGQPPPPSVFIETWPSRTPIGAEWTECSPQHLRSGVLRSCRAENQLRGNPR